MTPLDIWIVSVTGGCLGGDFGDDAATIARAAQWQRDNPELAERQAEFFHSLGLDPGGAVAKEELYWRSGSRSRLTTGRLQARVWHLRPRLHVATRVPVL